VLEAASEHARAAAHAAREVDDEPGRARHVRLTSTKQS
jgi:hypothetical protein